jgi:ribonuclease HI
MAPPPAKSTKITDFWNIYGVAPPPEPKPEPKKEIKTITISSTIKTQPHLLQVQKMSAHIDVYTDGSCIHNGKPNAKAGIGVYFGENDPRNVSKRVVGKQSNNTGELTAIITALTILKPEIQFGEKVVVHTDSEYAIKCMTTYGRKLEKKGFLEPAPNIDLIKQGLSLLRPNVSFHHVFSHTGKQDAHSLGNERADALASKAIGVEPTAKQAKFCLRVSYQAREKAKEMGAKWDKKRKCWYVFDENHPAVKVFGILQ